MFKVSNKTFLIFQQNRKSDSRAKKISAEKIFWKWTFDFSTIFGFGHISAQVKSTPSKEPFSRARTNHQIVGNLFYSCTRIGPNDIFSAQSGITTSGLTLIVLKVHLFLTTKHTVFGQVRFLKVQNALSGQYAIRSMLKLVF